MNPNQKNRKHFLLLLLLTLLTAGAWAQTGVVRGFVYDKKTGEPVIYTNVYLDGTSFGIATDVNGYFSITKIKTNKRKIKF